ncbi:hypothetical protein Taro_034404 [Colocasia esculenta]|uniref:Uncharacterized protein n=1 Tax=Colocasia esculenta TaxID=4460 RepID=A0A843W2U6_COLES|nr:hypothetical protein [Colocasia esculenta]
MASRDETNTTTRITALERKAMIEEAGLELRRPSGITSEKGGGGDPALRGKPLREALHVGAVVVDHVVPLHPPQPLPAGGVQLLVPPGAAPRTGGRGFVRSAAGGAPGRDAGVGVEVSVGGDEGGLGPVGLYEAAAGGPVVGVPEAGVDPHGLGTPLASLFLKSLMGIPSTEKLEPEKEPVRTSVEQSREICGGGGRDVLGVPEDGVGVEVLGGVEPELELLLPIALPLREHVGVQCVGVPAEVAQELEVDLVVETQTHIVGGDGAGGVAGDELYLHVDLAEEVLVLGLEPGAGGLVEGQGEQLAVVEDLASAIAPGNVEVPVEVGGHNKGEQGEEDGAERGSQHHPHRGIGRQSHGRGSQLELVEL